MNTDRMGLTIATIVCAYNEGRLLPGCLYSLRAQTRPPDDILVINNASTDETGAVARAVPGVRVLDEPCKGLVVARETARLAAQRRHRRLRGRRLPRADHVARARRGAVLAAAARRGRDRAVPVLRLGLERPRAGARLRPAGGAADPRARAPRASASARSSTAATSPCGATRSAQIGGFDRRIEFHGEDTNLGRRLTAIGRVALCRECWVWTSARRYRAMGKRAVFSVLRAELLVGDPPASSGGRRPSRREGLRRAGIRTVPPLRLSRPHHVERRTPVAARGGRPLRPDRPLRRDRDHRPHPDEARSAGAGGAARDPRTTRVLGDRGPVQAYLEDIAAEAQRAQPPVRPAGHARRRDHAEPHPQPARTRTSSR